MKATILTCKIALEEANEQWDGGMGNYFITLLSFENIYRNFAVICDFLYNTQVQL